VDRLGKAGFGGGEAKGQVAPRERRLGEAPAAGSCRRSDRLLLAAFAGSLLPVNRGWEEPEQGTTVYLRSNGIHVDLVMPANAQGLDWRKLLPPRDVRQAPAEVRWYGFGAGERRVYLETPTWSDLTLARPGRR
jgi:hypothetical protein